MITVNSLSELNDLAATGKLLGLVRVSIDLYHEGPGISSSGLKEMLKSPAHYRAYRDKPQADTPTFRFGRLVHLRLLEPELFKTSTIVEVKIPGDGRSAAVKAARAAQETQFAVDSLGKEILSPGEASQLEAIAKATSQNKLASAILGGGSTEVSVYWVDEATGVLCKARADLIRGEAIFDLKTCYSAQAREFQKALVGYQYHVSAALYVDGFQTVMPVKHFSWIALEKTPPYAFGFYAADQELLNAGRVEYQKALLRYAECEATGVWPGYEQTFINVSLTGV
jgi:hypothetical protein